MSQVATICQLMSLCMTQTLEEEEEEEKIKCSFRSPTL
jgi:hypothetical protein